MGGRLMATLIPEIQVNDFNKLAAVDLKRLQCCEVFDGDEYIFTFIRPGTDYIRMSCENFGQLSNAVSGESLANVKKGKRKSMAQKKKKRGK
jgi:hypothetical protein